MLEQNWVLLTRVPDLIIRGALIARLGEDQIEVYAPERDVIVNLNSTTPNLSLEGYSALFEGYAVYVPKPRLQQAQTILEKFQEEMKPSQSEREDIDHPQRFYSMAVMSLFFPLLTHAVAFYHLALAIRKRQKFKKVKFVLSLLLLLISAFAGWALIAQSFSQWSLF